MNRQFNHETGEYLDDYETQQHNATDEQLKEFQDSHSELSKLSQYPPFSLDKNKTFNFGSSIMDDENKWKIAEDKSRPHSASRIKFADDLEEASLYQKRYNDPVEAQKAAMQIHGLPSDHPDLMRLG
jgi:hypothetical protein